MPGSNSAQEKPQSNDSNCCRGQDVGLKSENLAFGPSFVLAVSPRACPLSSSEIWCPCLQNEEDNKCLTVMFLKNKCKNVVKAVFHYFSA